MPKFKYDLEPLLRFREQTEDRERETLSRLCFLHRNETAARLGLENQYRETLCEMTEKLAGGSIEDERNWYRNYLRRLSCGIGECTARLARLQSQIRVQKEVVIEAAKKRKILASMKSRKEKEFLAEERKKEQKTIDELSVTRYARQDGARDIAGQRLGARNAVRP